MHQPIYRIVAIALVCLACVGCRQQSSVVPSSDASTSQAELDKGNGSTLSSRLDPREDLRDRLEDLSNASFAERARLMELFVDYLAQPQVSAEDVRQARRLAQHLEQVDANQAKKFCDAVTKTLNTREDLRDEVAWLTGLAQRLHLVGKPFTLEGQAVDGQRIDWSAFRGRTVLVEFWATWCGPCLDELQNTLNFYDRFHERGFEVIGVSTDTDVGRLRSFLQDTDLPWVTVHSPADSPNGLSQQLGIFSIPVCILIGPDGKVVSINARGAELEKYIESLLPEQR